MSCTNLPFQYHWLASKEELLVVFTESVSSSFTNRFYDDEGHCLIPYVKKIVTFWEYVRLEYSTEAEDWDAELEQVCDSI